MSPGRKTCAIQLDAKLNMELKFIKSLFEHNYFLERTVLSSYSESCIKCAKFSNTDDDIFIMVNDKDDDDDGWSQLF